MTAAPGKKFDRVTAQRLTNCCSAYSTFDDATLVCKVCRKPVGVGEGDGTEYGKACKTGRACKSGKFANSSGGGRGYCPTCYQRERRLEAGTGKLGAGEVPEPPLARAGGRELRALVPHEVVITVNMLATGAGLSEVEFVRRALTFIAGQGPDPRRRA